MIVDVETIKQQLNITDNSDDALLSRKISAAQDHIDRLLGYKIEATYGGAGQEPIPASLVEAVCQLAAHWYENREASSVGMNANLMPFGVQEIIREYRNWSF